jgi:glycosyltransferase involved in cell wall biosynthesis
MPTATVGELRPATAEARLRVPDRGDRRPRILVLSENQSVPSDRRVWAISTSLVRMGCEVLVVCPQGDDLQRASGERASFEVLEGVEIHRFPLRFATGGPLGYVREYGVAFWRIWHTVRRLCAEQPFDVVHGCNPPDLMLFAAWPARRRKAQLIFDHHDLTPELFRTRFGAGHDLLHRLTLLLERLTFAAADFVVATNESYAQIARTRGHARAADVFVVRNGPDLRRFRPTTPDPALKRGQPLLISYVGVMAPQDGVDHALRALALLSDRRSDWHAVLAGEGDARPALQQLAEDLGIADAVEFAGWLNDEQISRLLSTSDVCLAPEPLTPLNDVSTMIKIAEYLAMSCPVVAYDLRESRRTAGDAALYATPNQVSSFAERIAELLGDPERRVRMGEIGRSRVEQSLSWEQSEMVLLDAYRRALARHASGRRRAPALDTAGLRSSVAGSPAAAATTGRRRGSWWAPHMLRSRDWRSTSDRGSAGPGASAGSDPERGKRPRSRSGR